MELETTRLVCKWLKDPSSGVNALLPAQPLSPPDVTASLDLSQYLLEDVLNDYEDEYAAQDREPVNNRTLLVMCNGATLLPFRTGQPQPGPQWEGDNLEVGVVYLLRDAGAKDLDRRVMYYSLRAVRQSLARLAALNGPARVAARQENGVELLTLRKMQYERLAGRIGRAAMLGVVRCNWHVRDTRP